VGKFLFLLLLWLKYFQNGYGSLELLRSIWYSIGKEAQQRSWADVYNVIWEIPANISSAIPARQKGGPIVQLPITDFQIHASYHRGTRRGHRCNMTVTNIVRRCEELDFDSVGILEHLNSDPVHPLEKLAELVAEFRTVCSPVSLFVGSELDILDEQGTVSGSREIKEDLRLDYYLASAHSSAQMDDVDSPQEFSRRYNQMIIGAIEKCDFIDVIAHPWAEVHRVIRRGIFDSWTFDDVPESCRKELIEALAEHDTAIEVNAKTSDNFNNTAYRSFLQRVCRAGIKVAVGSDAHCMEQIGGAMIVNELLQEIGYTQRSLWAPKRKG